jgi:transposase
MASIKLKFRVSSLPEKEGTLYFQIIHERVVKQIGTSYRIFESEWDKQRNDIAHLSLITPDRLNIIKSIREKLAWDKSRLNKIIQNLEKNGNCFSTDEIIHEYFVQSSDKTTVFEYIKIQMTRLKIAGKERTSETYKQMLFSFMKFRSGEDLSFDMVNEGLISQYESHMRISDLCRNTTSFYLRIFRSIYNRAVEDGLTEQSYPFKRVYTGVDKTSKRAINLKEIKKIKDLDLSQMPALDFARDIFLFSFYMRGMSFVDIAYLKKKNLVNGFVVYNRRKTGQQLVIKWEKSMDDIIVRHPNEQSTFLLPIITREDGTERKQYLNSMLLINKHLKKIAELAKINIPLTMYVARHSWASIAQSQNIPMRVISLGMGHDNEETTRIYLASIQTSVIDSANNKILNLLDKGK